MGRYIARFRGPAPPADQLARLRQRLSIVDSAPRMFLFEADEAEVKKLADEFPEWTIAKEISYKIPEQPVRTQKKPTRDR
jgi:hypothetical protein